MRGAFIKSNGLAHGRRLPPPVLISRPPAPAAPSTSAPSPPCPNPPLPHPPPPPTAARAVPPRAPGAVRSPRAPRRRTPRRARPTARLPSSRPAPPLHSTPPRRAGPARRWPGGRRVQGVPSPGGAAPAREWKALRHRSTARRARPAPERSRAGGGRSPPPTQRAPSLGATRRPSRPRPASQCRRGASRAVARAHQLRCSSRGAARRRAHRAEREGRELPRRRWLWRDPAARPLARLPEWAGGRGSAAPGEGSGRRRCGRRGVHGGPVRVAGGSAQPSQRDTPRGIVRRAAASRACLQRSRPCRVLSAPAPNRGLARPAARIGGAGRAWQTQRGREVARVEKLPEALVARQDAEARVEARRCHSLLRAQQSERAQQHAVLNPDRHSSGSALYSACRLAPSFEARGSSTRIPSDSNSCAIVAASCTGAIFARDSAALLELEAVEPGCGAGHQ